MTLVVRGVPMGQFMFTPIDNSSQDLPPSLDLKAFGLVPANIVSGSSGSVVTDQICMLSMGDSTCTQVLPLSSLLNIPPSVPAKILLDPSG